MMVQQTFDIKDCKDELFVLKAVLDALHDGNSLLAKQVLVARIDVLMKEPALIRYDPRAA